MEYAGEQRVREARRQYFEDNNFGADGGYGERWVFLEFGWLKVPVYNSAARRRAVPLHDLHHIVTGYSTTPSGEAEIACWEIAAGTYDKWFALIINLPALLYGFVLWPGRCRTAWRRGRASESLYQVDFDETLLDCTVAELRARVLIAEKSGSN